MLEALNDELRAKAADRAAILTIACKDTADAVTKFMAENDYDYAVAMGDEDVVRAYGVTGYPHRVAVTPTGRAFEIPFTADWLGILKPLMLGGE